MRRRRAGSAWILGLSLCAMACGPSAGPEDKTSTLPSEVAAASRPNVLLISIDTLRADRLSGYGHSRQTSPNLDRLAADGVRYERALAPTPWTLPSHAAMLTGVDPYLLGLTAQWRWLPQQAPSLAAALGERGYRSAAFVDSKPRGFVGAKRGFDRGFDLYAHAPHGEPVVPRYDVARTVDAALSWLEEDTASPFFLFLHTRSVHAIPNDEPCRDARCSPYFAPEPFGRRFLPSELPREVWDNGDGRRGQDYLWWLNEHISAGESPRDVLSAERLQELEALYDGAIAYTDDHLGRLFEGLDALGQAQNTLVIVTSDHGEAFLEHRLLLHQEVYDSSLRIPLLMRWPAAPWSRGEVVTAPVTLEDIPPSVVAWVDGIEGPANGGPANDGLADVAVPDDVATMTGRILPLQDAPLGDLSLEDPATEGHRPLFAYYLFPEKFAYQAFALEQGERRLVVHNPAVDALTTEIWATEDGQTWQLVSDAEDETLRQELRRHRQRHPWAEVDDPAHGKTSGGANAIDTLGYID